MKGLGKRLKMISQNIKTSKHEDHRLIKVQIQDLEMQANPAGLLQN